jgi:Cys-rich protein (TIGR01571 family)
MPHILSQPEGGVKVGESFRALVLRKGSSTKAELTSGSMQEHASSFDIPTGQWRDDICDCCTCGACHAQCWLSCCCALIALGQVMTRLNLNVLGKPANSRFRGWTSPFYVMTFLVAVYWLFFVLPYYATLLKDPSTKPSLWYNLIVISFMIYFVTAHTRTRNLLRRKYKIGTGYGCLGDCCGACWCSSCSVCQMACHTADYRYRHKARCCTETGLDEDVEPLVPLALTASAAHIV